MRILLISPMLPGIGGVSVSSHRLLLNLKKDGFNAQAFNIRFREMAHNTPAYLFLRFLIIPFYIIFNHKFDIIHCHVPGVLRKLYISLFKPFYHGAKLIFTIHGDAFPLVTNRFAQKALEKADKIICVKPGDSENLPSQLKSKSVDIPAFILPRIIDETYIPQSILSFCKKSKEESLLIFNGAAIVSEKYNDLYGFCDMLDAFDLLEHRGEYKLLMVQNGVPNNQESETLMKRVKLRIKSKPNIKFVEGEEFELCPLFRYAKLYVRPTKTDGDSLSIREALAMGCNVVASNVVCRPKGVIVYNDRAQLADTIEYAMNQKAIHYPTKDYYQDIKEVYTQI